MTNCIIMSLRGFVNLCSRLFLINTIQNFNKQLYSYRDIFTRANNWNISILHNHTILCTYIYIVLTSDYDRLVNLELFLDIKMRQENFIKINILRDQLYIYICMFIYRHFLENLSPVTVPLLSWIGKWSSSYNSWWIGNYASPFYTNRPVSSMFDSIHLHR